MVHNKEEQVKWCFAVRELSIGSGAEVRALVDILLHQIVYVEKDGKGNEPQLKTTTLNTEPVELLLDRNLFQIGSTPTSLDVSFESVLINLTQIFKNPHEQPVAPPRPTPGETFKLKRKRTSEK